MNYRLQFRWLAVGLIAWMGGWAAGCTASFGPGYSVEKQEIRVHFDSNPDPHVQVEADYQLCNTGNQPLSSLEIRFPAGRRLDLGSLQTRWDHTLLTPQSSPDDPRNSQVSLPKPWPVSDRHTLRISFEVHSAPAEDTGLKFAPDAFFLPSAGWSPLLMQPSGLFAFGGVPPKKWELVTQVPSGFLVHSSGEVTKTEHKNQTVTIRATQRPKDIYPFVIAGRYQETRINDGARTIHLWTRSAQQNSGELSAVKEALLHSTEMYDAIFGKQMDDVRAFWIVECPDISGCFTNLSKVTATLLGENENVGERPSAEMASVDTVMVDLRGGVPSLAATAAPSLAASWLGYGQNPGFFERQPPLSQFPAFAASLPRNPANSQEVRTETIRRALKLIPKTAPAPPQKTEDPEVVRAKSFLFFYALQDRYGIENFRKAVTHMLTARRGHGFDLDDLIAAFEEETHQNVAEFVRLWMKHPGVPTDFRERYESTSAAASTSTQEPIP